MARTIITGNNKIRIIGYADSTGPADYNKWLSQRRTFKVEQYLIVQGVDKTAIVSSGLGETTRFSSSESEDGMQQNRVVEIVLDR